MKKLTVALLAAAAVGANAQLYGVGPANNGTAAYHFSVINTLNGAATQQFTFSVPNTTAVNFLTYVPQTNRFLAVGVVSAFSSVLVEIDAGAQTATTVSHGIPNAYFEGLEYMSSLGGVVVSHGPGGFFTGSIALLNPITYGLISTGAVPGASDSDIIFDDGTGAVNTIDANNPNSNGWQRNIINNPFGAMSVTGIANNTFNPAGGEPDLAWKANESRLFLSQLTQLSTVGALNAISGVGAYGTSSLGTPIEVTGIAAVPEPATMAVLGLGALAAIRKRRQSK
ncbi:MAG: PEP-CTERM sorting domain-containing protein [Armatimonadetes bacterium]|nr:PEP-CTERM sorting domain-containing protein [Armatimonadota bacterium]